MRPAVGVLICSLGGLLTACDGGGPTGPLTGLPRELSLAEQHLVQTDNTFAFELFRVINAGEDSAGNVFVSPLSVAMALGMTYNGAANETRTAMAEALDLQGMSIGDVNRAYRGVIDLLQGLDSRVEFQLANSIWFRPEFTPLQAFQDTVRTYFDADARALDFSAPGAADTINGWVDQHTNGKIKTIVPDPIPDYIVMYLINTIYFKGAWTYQFDKKLTRDEPFTLAEGAHASVPMMSPDGELPVRVSWGSGVTVVELPYGRQAYAMTIVLPSDAAGAQGLARSVTEQQWDAWLAGLDSTSIEVSLPKFTLEYAIRLNDVLKALGMAIAFDPCRADFSDMFGSTGFYIDDVRHKTFVEVNEEGTEAAAATSVGIGLTSARPSIVVDRPFLFAIRERLTGTILFLGKILDPRASAPRAIVSTPETCQP
jgi:serine protease inhibitor